jgi:hypothetical protein
MLAYSFARLRLFCSAMRNLDCEHALKKQKSYEEYCDNRSQSLGFSVTFCKDAGRRLLIPFKRWGRFGPKKTTGHIPVMK